MITSTLVKAFERRSTIVKVKSFHFGDPSVFNTVMIMKSPIWSKLTHVNRLRISGTRQWCPSECFAPTYCELTPRCTGGASENKVVNVWALANILIEHSPVRQFVSWSVEWSTVGLATSTSPPDLTTPLPKPEDAPSTKIFYITC